MFMTLLALLSNKKGTTMNVIMSETEVKKLKKKIAKMTRVQLNEEVDKLIIKISSGDFEGDKLDKIKDKAVFLSKTILRKYKD